MTPISQITLTSYFLTFGIAWWQLAEESPRLRVEKKKDTSIAKQWPVRTIVMDAVIITNFDNFR